MAYAANIPVSENFIPNEAVFAHYTESEALLALTHEIKNPAALAMAYVGLIRQTQIPEVQDYCNRIDNALKMINNLAHEMLYVMTPASSIAFDMMAMLSEILEAYRAAWPKLNFSLTSGSGELSYFGEEPYIRMVFTNLLKNAVAAVQGDGGEVSIFVERTADQVVVTIRDNGWGLGLGNPQTGTGLGLGICKWILGRKGGGIELREAEDGGCAATVYLPIYGEGLL